MNTVNCDHLISLKIAQTDIDSLIGHVVQVVFVVVSH